MVGKISGWCTIHNNDVYNKRIHAQCILNKTGSIFVVMPVHVHILDNGVLQMVSYFFFL